MPTITIVGLGPGDAGQLTRAAWDALCAAHPLFLRTAIHPTVAALPVDLPLHPFDARYEAATDFAEVYQSIAATLVERAEAGQDVTYAVPGHPLVAEATTRHLLALAKQRGIATRIIAGLSFVEPTCEVLGIDPLEHGLQLLDALDLRPSEFPSLPTPTTPNTQRSTHASESWASLHGHSYDPPLVPFPLVATRPALVCQVYSRAVASEVKLSLMARYPAEHSVTVVRAAGVSGAERVWTVPLHELDRQDGIDHLTSLFVPPLAPLDDTRSPEGVDYVVARLLGPGGCPWDREQSPQSMRAGLLEEAHEVLEALDAGDETLLAEELGDLLLNILMQAEMARQAGSFDAGDVYAGIAEKLIVRHPHVFGQRTVSGSGEVLRNWEAIKQAERAAKGQAKRGPLDGIPAALPALAAAQKLTSKAARAGFDSPDIADAWALVDEELAELREAASSGDQLQIEAELGDLLLATSKLGWKLETDAESALRAASSRFRERFMHMQDLLAGRSLPDLTIAEKLDLWEQARL
jgi:tetrapyrrole methylase family protein/MazG family protein